MKLFSYFRSSCAYRVRIALNVKLIPYQLIPVHLLKNGGEQYSEKYKKYNASAQVPTLLDDTRVIGQSMAIMEYLEAEFPNPPLLPAANFDKAIVRQMCEVMNSGVQPLQNLSVTQYLTNNFKALEEDKKQWMDFWIQRGFESFETLLQQHAGKYCFGDQITFADCFLIPQVFSSVRFGVDLTPFPKSLEVYKSCMQLTDFIRASPEKQPDYQP
ncbi:MAG: maleylacetoacetate isomerase [Bdellovibrionaceae bacterium]|nr:maleylacetoacetate isomerase [Pseudobdellovibrionaceae bacterium]